MSTPKAPYAGDIFNTGQLLFDERPLAAEAEPITVPEVFYERGWTILNSVPNELAALAMQEQFISGIDPERLPLHDRFADRIRLAKADEIPVCDDILASHYQVMHFDMGHPFIAAADPLFVAYAGIYKSPARVQHELDGYNTYRAEIGVVPVNRLPEPTAHTRIMPIANMSSMPADEIDARLNAYAKEHGDGWAEHNSGRLAAGVRVLDALSEAPELHGNIDKTVGQWFGNEVKTDRETAFNGESAFFAKHGIDLGKREQRIALKAGQLLFFDNTRTLHGRIGHRRAKEVFNFMFGVDTIPPHDINALRKSISQTLTTQ